MDRRLRKVEEEAVTRETCHIESQLKTIIDERNIWNDFYRFLATSSIHNTFTLFSAQLQLN